jgi:hypothetical protein
MSPLMDNLSKKSKALPGAAKTFPKAVFREWLRRRRGAADLLFPGWRELEGKGERLYYLDLAVVLYAQSN